MIKAKNMASHYWKKTYETPQQNVIGILKKNPFEQIYHWIRTARTMFSIFLEFFSKVYSSVFTINGSISVYYLELSPSNIR